jgi:formylglycine-generating enzyme required for sulfatase activity
MRMLPAGSVPQGFVHIPAGTFRFGTTRDAYLPPMEQALPDFMIGIFPVTAVAYQAFLNHLHSVRPQDAARRVPRNHEGREQLWALEGGGYAIPSALGWTDYTPIVGICFDDAVAYCRWLKQQTGQPYRLPTEEEWEKAARGTEGRMYPWGNAWEPAYASCPATSPGPWPPPAGSSQYDCSPFGACDFAGGVREWTGTRGVSRSASVMVRGGSFATGDDDGRPLWTRETVNSNRTAPDLGFRLALDVAF